MSTTTLCPTCNTRFKIHQEQLEAHNGLVRCGRCQAIFDAREQLEDGQPSPQLDLPIAPVSGGAAAVAAKPSDNKIKVAKPVTLAQQVAFMDNLDDVPSEPVKKKHGWLRAIGSALLLIMLLGQAAYSYRVELAANMPGLKPALTAYCELLQCTVSLPQKADLMSIDASNLEADPAQASVIVLNAILRNRAPYAQAYPSLELTLTDTDDKPLARRIFRPAEYLRPGENEKQGLAAGRELNIGLNLDTADLKPSGYQLFLFYPQ
jgi:predicted Zn finger-like uncharacterized protein